MDSFAESVLPIVGIAFGVGGLCLLSTWIGFSVAQLLKHVPSQKYCAVLGAIFVWGSGSVFFFLSREIIHILGAYIAIVMCLFVAPLVAFLGSLLVRRTI
jgi:hypothetical protein